MNAHEAIQLSIDMGSYIANAYVQDLNDAELLHRPGQGCNHINWQLGHCILSEHNEIEKLFPGTMPPLPPGFAEKYGRENAASDDPKKFCTKAELLATLQAQRAATLKAFAQTSDADFDRPTGVDYAPSIGAMFALQGSHYLMHVGQWAVVRRQLGRQPLF
ncbi:MAG: DinB family protein [Planctomycetaceae bacterium]|nr:DinB family protein [Planctomycetaceae bacterium]